MLPIRRQLNVSDALFGGYGKCALILAENDLAAQSISALCHDLEMSADVVTPQMPLSREPSARKSISPLYNVLLLDWAFEERAVLFSNVWRNWAPMHCRR